MTTENTSDFLTCIKVRPKGNREPFYLYPEKDGSRIVFSGRNIDGWTIEVTSGEAKGMLDDPQIGFHGYVAQFV